MRCMPNTLSRPIRRLASILSALALALVARAPARAQTTPTVAELMASADDAWRARRYDAALDTYTRVLSRDSSVARAVIRAATLLSWRNDLDRSIALFRQYVRLAPDDGDGRVGLARVLAWRGRYVESLALTDSLLAANPRQRDAALLAAQTLAWSGHLEAAIARYRTWLSAHEDDAEAWSALAQTWHWAGRPEETRQAVEHALKIDPRSDVARAQLDWAVAALAFSFEPSVTGSNDSDDNRSTLYSLRGGIATPWGARLIADGSFRTTQLDVLTGTAASLRASSSWSPVDGRVGLRGELGATRLDATSGPGTPSATHYEPLIAARISARPVPRFSLGAGVSHAAFDETAPLILAGIASTTVEGDADVSLQRRLSFGAGGGWTHLSGGSGPNSRIAASTTLRCAFTGVASLAATVRGFGYDHAAFDGYFAPKRYVLAELSSRVRLGGDRGWGLDAEAGLGDQTITAFDNSSASRFAQRLTAGVGYRFAEGVEWGLSGGFANVASPTTISSADYRAYSIALKGRWRL